jgi:hypothetical protein
MPSIFTSFFPKPTRNTVANADSITTTKEDIVKLLTEYKNNRNVDLTAEIEKLTAEIKKLPEHDDTRGEMGFLKELAGERKKLNEGLFNYFNLNLDVIISSVSQNAPSSAINKSCFTTWNKEEVKKALDDMIDYFEQQCGVREAITSEESISDASTPTSACVTKDLEDMVKILKWIKTNDIPCSSNKTAKLFGGLSQKRKNKQKTHKKRNNKKTTQKKGGKSKSKKTKKQQKTKKDKRQGGTKGTSLVSTLVHNMKPVVSTLVHNMKPVVSKSLPRTITRGGSRGRVTKRL